jgi:hypothetical protein
VLIDRGHCWWIVGTAAAAGGVGGLWLVLNCLAVRPLTGGTTVGLWYGLLGSGLMVYAGLLAAHRRLARWPWLPRRAWLLKGHIWLGLLSFWVILFHSGFRWGGFLEVLLWLVFGAVVASGIFGLVMQGVLPRLLTRELAEETPYEQMPYVCSQLHRRALQLTDQVCGGELTPVRVQLREFCEKTVGRYLEGKPDATNPLPDAARARGQFAQFLALPELGADRAALEEMEQLCNRRRAIAVQERIHHWLHGWLLFHVPLSAALLILGVTHALASLWY